MNALLLIAAIYGTLDITPATTNLVRAPYASCTGVEIVTNVIDEATVVTTNYVWTETASLDEPTANRLGWKLVLDEPPAPPSGHYAVATGWEYREVEVEVKGEGEQRTDSNSTVNLNLNLNLFTQPITRIYRTYAFEPLPPEPARRIYKYDLSAACIEYGEITNLIGFISADVGVKWMWDAAEILVEDDPYFVAATNEVIQSGLIGEQKVKAILDRAYELGQLSTAK